jgi:SAM-dependent methyltransferase
VNAELLRRVLAHPRTRGLDIDDPATTALRRDIVRGKPFLRDVYLDWYRALAAAVPGGSGEVLELGSGGGFLSDVVPGLITSDVFVVPGIKAVLDARALPFRAASLRAILMTNVLHHVPQPGAFLAGAARAVRPGGVIAMIEPWVSAWARLVYTRLHHELFEPDADEDQLGRGGPLSAANGALPWILFAREQASFERRFPEWRIEQVRPMMPFRYLVSGGVSMRSLMPGWTTGLWRTLERQFDPYADTWAMFAFVALRRTDVVTGTKA